MTRADDELDEYGKRVLLPLRSAPPIDITVAEQEKAKFLKIGESLYQDLFEQTKVKNQRKSPDFPGVVRRMRSIFILKPLIAGLLALIILLGSSFTVYAAQDSLPGEPLYLIKSWSEDLRLAMTTSPQAKLDLTLEYTERRVNEITNLAASGKAPSEQTSDRYQGELENLLELAASMDNEPMLNALGKIKHLAKNQGMTLEELITKLPEQAQPAIIHLQQRLEEQVTLSTIGENDPQTFRWEVRERQHRRSGMPKPSSGAGGSDTTPSDGSVNPIPAEAEKGHGNDKNKTSEPPGQGDQGSGQGKGIPGNGKNGSAPTLTPEP